MNINNWKEFTIQELFETEKGKVSTGANIPVQDLVENGSVPRVTVTNSNNGICGYYDYCGNKPQNYRVYDNFISVSFLGTVFYHKGQASLDMKVHCLKPVDVELNKYTGSFLVSVVEKSIMNIDYSDQISSSVLYNMSLLLPATPSGDPDWDYMESYMKEMEEKAKERLDRLEEMRKQKKKKIDVSGWGEFQVGELFDIKPTKAYKLNNAFLLDDGNTPVLANSSYNNGIGGYSTLEATEKGNIITFSDTVDANTIFYQEYEFIGYAHVQGMYPKGNYKQQWNSYCLKFFASVFRETALLKGYNYGNKFRRDNAMKMSILLPVTSAGDPDWAYMEQYMREMEEKAKSRIEKLSILRK